MTHLVASSLLLGQIFHVIRTPSASSSCAKSILPEEAEAQYALQLAVLSRPRCTRRHPIQLCPFRDRPHQSLQSLQCSSQRALLVLHLIGFVMSIDDHLLMGKPITGTNDTKSNHNRIAHGRSTGDGTSAFCPEHAMQTSPWKLYCLVLWDGEGQA